MHGIKSSMGLSTKWSGLLEHIQRLNPATQALLIQMLAFGMVLMSSCMVDLFGYPLSTFQRCALQALFAITLSCFMSMAVWWHVIHGLFPILVGLMLKYPITPAFYLYGLILTSAVYWSTFRSQVPYFPSNDQVTLPLKNLLLQQGPARVIDIGSGLGGLMMQLAQSFPRSTFSGIEIAPLPWAMSVLRSKFTRSPVKFLYGDYRHLNFGDYDVVYAYLSPVVMSAVWQKAVKEMKPGSLLISNEFNIIDMPAHMTLETNVQSSRLYVWRM